MTIFYHDAEKGIYWIQERKKDPANPSRLAGAWKRMYCDFALRAYSETELKTAYEALPAEVKSSMPEGFLEKLIEHLRAKDHAEISDLPASIEKK